MKNIELLQRLSLATHLAKQAGCMALELRPTLKIFKKAGGPFTDAELLIERFISEEISKAFLNDGIISEEGFFKASANDHTWFIDPIDGTFDYISTSEEDFVVMIGLAINGQARLGAIYHPPSETLWQGVIDDVHRIANVTANETHDLKVVPNKKPLKDLRLLVSKNHPSKSQDLLIKKLAPKSVIKRGSIGLKAMLIIEDLADLYVNFSSLVMPWDTCAPKAIVDASGGIMEHIDQKPLKYSLNEPHGSPFFIANIDPQELLEIYCR